MRPELISVSAPDAGEFVTRMRFTFAGKREEMGMILHCIEGSDFYDFQSYTQSLAVMPKRGVVNLFTIDVFVRNGLHTVEELLIAAQNFARRI